MKRLIFIPIMLIAVSIFAEPFNKKLSDSERQTIAGGEVLIRNISSMKDICMEKTDSTERIISTMEKLDPAFAAEIIQVRPYKGNEDLKENINNALLNIEDYVGIPYFSERTQEWYELYSSAQIDSIAESEDKKTKSIDCTLEMSLFGKFKSEITVEDNDSFYYYELKNKDKLVYHGKFTAVKPEKMVSCITLFRDGDNWILYAIGGVDVPKIWFLKDRIETSFMNRIKTFCNFIFQKI